MPEASVDHLYYHVDRAELRIKVTWPIIFLQRMPQNGIKEVIPLIPMISFDMPPMKQWGSMFPLLESGKWQK